ncbi:thaumatin [Lactarius quietus]|nr:thaumatin [Lactarius quietus]
MGRTLSVYNNCSYTIWPALHTDSDTAPNYPTGWAAPPSTSVEITLPDDWSGHVWGRRDCDFTTNPGPDSCLDGGCPGGLLCTGPGQSPVTVAEFKLSSDDNAFDYYDISLINGFNIPMIIDNDNRGECGFPRCSVDLGADCPTPLKEAFDPTGFPGGCKSACAAGLAPDPNNDPNCCTGIYDSAQSCPSSGVQYYSYFKSHCPDTLVYAFDGSDGVRYSCDSGSETEYEVRFCG